MGDLTWPSPLQDPRNTTAKRFRLQRHILSKLEDLKCMLANNITCIYVTPADTNIL